MRYGIGWLITEPMMKAYNKKFYFTDYHSNFFLFWRGALGFLGNILWYEGVLMLPLGDAISLILLSPCGVLFLAYFFLGEKITTK